MTDYCPQKITFGEMREMGVRGLLIYCADYRCSHSIAINADAWPDDLRLSDIEPRFVCQACGKGGADVRPDLPGIVHSARGPVRTSASFKLLGYCLREFSNHGLRHHGPVIARYDMDSEIASAKFVPTQRRIQREIRQRLDLSSEQRHFYGCRSRPIIAQRS